MIKSRSSVKVYAVNDEIVEIGTEQYIAVSGGGPAGGVNIETPDGKVYRVDAADLKAAVRNASNLGRR